MNANEIIIGEFYGDNAPEGFFINENNSSALSCKKLTFKNPELDYFHSKMLNIFCNFKKLEYLNINLKCEFDEIDLNIFPNLKELIILTDYVDVNDYIVID